MAFAEAMSASIPCGIVAAVGPEMSRGKINLIGADDLRIRIVDENPRRWNRTRHSASAVWSSSSRRSWHCWHVPPRPRADRSRRAGRANSTILSCPRSRFEGRDSAHTTRVRPPRVGHRRTPSDQGRGSFRAVVVVVERGVAVVETEEAIGHTRLPGELDRLVREPERFLSQPDPPILAGPGVESAAGDESRTRGRCIRALPTAGG